MSRLARVVIPNIPQHVTHRRNRRGDIFFRESDRDAFLTWLGDYCAVAQLGVWAYCLKTTVICLSCRGAGEADVLLHPDRPFPGPVEDWAGWLAIPQPGEEVEELRRCTSTGRPCGDKEFVQRLSELTGRVLAPKGRGRKPMGARAEIGDPSRRFVRRVTERRGRNWVPVNDLSNAQLYACTGGVRV